jgi:hypothetical protein
MDEEVLNRGEVVKFRKKPVVIDAVQWTGDNLQDICEEFGNTESFFIDGHDKLCIRTLEGIMESKSGDWIIRGVKGEFYSCDSTIFEMTYEKVE